MAKRVKKDSMRRRSMASTSKKLMWLIMINGILWIWCSYALALMGYSQIADSLSNKICDIVFGQIGFYFITKTVENVFKYNEGKFFGKSISGPSDVMQVPPTPTDEIQPPYGAE